MNTISHVRAVAAASAERRSGARLPLVLVPILFALAGCRGCFCTNAAKAVTDPVPDDVALAETRKALERSPKPLSTICGVSVSGLADMTLAIVKSSGLHLEVRVQGKALIDPDAGPPEEDEDGEDDEDASTPDARAPDAGAKPTAAAKAVPSRTPLVVDPMKALVCTGVLAVVLSPDLDSHGNRTGVQAGTVTVESVETPGVHFDKASQTGGGSHRRRRHHHHH